MYVDSVLLLKRSVLAFRHLLLQRTARRQYISTRSPNLILKTKIKVTGRCSSWKQHIVKGPKFRLEVQPRRRTGDLKPSAESRRDVTKNASRQLPAFSGPEVLLVRVQYRLSARAFIERG